MFPIFGLSAEESGPASIGEITIFGIISAPLSAPYDKRPWGAPIISFIFVGNFTILFFFVFFSKLGNSTAYHSTTAYHSKTAYHSTTAYRSNLPKNTILSLSRLFAYHSTNAYHSMTACHSNTAYHSNTWNCLNSDLNTALMLCKYLYLKQNTCKVYPKWKFPLFFRTNFPSWQLGTGII